MTEQCKHKEVTKELNVEMTQTKQIEANKTKRDQHNSLLELYRLRKATRDIMTFSNATVIRIHTDFGYACCFCPDQYPEPIDLKQHNIQSHRADIKNFMQKTELAKFFVKMDITSLNCNLCQQDFSTVEDIVDHLNNEHKKNIYPGIKKLIFPFKFDSDKLRCSICSKFSHTFKILQEHMHCHFINHICADCGAGFVTKGALKVHKASHGSGTYKCSDCSKVFDTQQKKKNHESSVHGRIGYRSVCQVCKERFKDYRKKEKHMVEAHGFASFDYKCQACNNSFVSKNALLAHTKRYHLLLRPHKCKQCDLSFFSSTELRIHTVSHTGQRMYMCDICMKSFGRKNTLKEHMRIHMNDRRYKCEHCGQAFVQKCSWKSHMRSKHGELV